MVDFLEMRYKFIIVSCLIFAITQLVSEFIEYDVHFYCFAILVSCIVFIYECKKYDLYEVE